MQKLTHSIAGIVFKTESSHPLPRLESPPFHHFRTHRQKPEVVQRFFRVDGETLDAAGPVSRERQERLASIPNVKESCLEEGLLATEAVLDAIDRHLAFPDSTQLWQSPGAVVIQDFHERVLEIYYTETLGGYEEEFQAYMPDYRVAANFHQFFSTFLPLFQCAILHGAGVVRNGKALLFFAPDEGGKTTLVRGLQGGRVLSDDHIAVRKADAVFQAYATPFGLMTDGPLCKEIGALFWLKKAPLFHLETMPPTEFLSKLWAENRMLTAFLPKGIKQSAFKLLIELCRSHPTYQLSFSKKDVDVRALDEIISKAGE